MPRLQIEPRYPCASPSRAGFTASAIYYGYMATASLALTLITGTIGFIATHWFVRAVYAAVKFD